MTRVILVTGDARQGIIITSDPRPLYELVKVVNTARQAVSLSNVKLAGPAPRRAVALPSHATLAVLTAPPPMLNEAGYDMIYWLANGLTLDQIAVQAGISRRMVSYQLEQLKEYMHVSTREEILMRAVDMGIL